MGKDNAEWRRRNFDKRKDERDCYNVRVKLKKMGELPHNLKGPMTPEQTMLNNIIKNKDFDLIKILFPEIKIRVRKNNGISRGARVSTPEEKLFNRAKSNAKHRNMDFNLELSDIVIPKLCPYLNIELLTEHVDSTHQHYATNDRIDSNLGYVKGNVQTISKLANTMKTNATEEQLITFATNILKIHAPELLK